MRISNIAKLLGLGVTIVAISAGAAFAATATASVNVRTGPGTQFRAIDTLRAGEQVRVLDQSGGWCAIDTAGPNGWVSCRYLTSDAGYRGYRSSPSVSIQFGFGTTQPRGMYYPWPGHNGHDDDGHWSGPHSSHHSSQNGMFSLSN